MVASPCLFVLGLFASPGFAVSFSVGAPGAPFGLLEGEEEVNSPPVTLAPPCFEMKAKASICISQDETLIESLGIAKDRIKIMIERGMDNKKKVLKGLIEIANKRIDEIKSGKRPALVPDDDAKYFAEVVVDLNEIDEPMIADPDVNNIDVSKRYTHDTIRPISFYNAEKEVDLGFVGSCMVHKGDIKKANDYSNKAVQIGGEDFRDWSNQIMEIVQNMPRARKLGKSSEAVPIYNSIIENHPYYSDAYFYVYFLEMEKRPSFTKYAYT